LLLVIVRKVGAEIMTYSRNCKQDESPFVASSEKAPLKTDKLTHHKLFLCLAAPVFYQSKSDSESRQLYYYFSQGKSAKGGRRRVYLLKIADKIICNDTSCK